MAVLLSAADSVPGREIAETLGLVTGSAVAPGTGPAPSGMLLCVRKSLC